MTVSAKQLRDYQIKLKYDVHEAWQAGFKELGHPVNVCAVAPTGSGKTLTMTSLFDDMQVVSVAIAHRQELVGQMSLTFAELGIVHRLIAPKAVIAFCIAQHIAKFGQSFYHPQSPIGVAGIDTLLRRATDLQQWFNQVKVWDIDECHHLLRDNKWGKGVVLFPNAFGVGFTATPKRADRKSLSRSRDGLFDAMVLGPTMRTLMEQGHLAQAKVFGPKPSIDRSAIEISKATGELNHTQTVDAVHKSRIVGDIVDSYLKFAPGKRGITFVVDIDQAIETAAAYSARGVRAVAVSSKTPDAVRVAMIDKFRVGQLDQLVNVDLFGEGMDVPAVEVVSMGRPTESFGLYTQQFGRCMRTAPGKTHGIVIDHVENVKVHKLPWRDIDWSLDDEEVGKKKRKADDAIPVTTCTTCFQAFEAVTSVCPHCGAKQIPAGRSLPEQVDGDLFEYGPELMAELSGEQRRIDGPVKIPPGSSEIAQLAMRRRWEERQQAQAHLRDTIALWAGIGRDVYGRGDSELYRRFYWKFGIDVANAKLLGAPEAEKLRLLVLDAMEDMK